MTEVKLEKWQEALTNCCSEWIESIKRLSEIQTKARTISNNSKFIEETTESMESDIKSHLGRISELLM